MAQVGKVWYCTLNYGWFEKINISELNFGQFWIKCVMQKRELIFVGRIYTHLVVYPDGLNQAIDRTPFSQQQHNFSSIRGSFGIFVQANSCSVY